MKYNKHKNLLNSTKIREGVFVRKFDNGYLLIKTLPWTVLYLNPNEIKPIIDFITGSQNHNYNELNKEEKKIFLTLRQEGFLSPVEIPEDDYYVALLILTTACNLRCKYCFAGENRYGLKKTIMDDNVIDSTLKFLARNITVLKRNKPQIEEVELGLFFFGGEPLLVFDKVKYATKQAFKTAHILSKALKIKVSPTLAITTNGTLLTEEIVEFLERNKIEVNISIDGPDNDKFRVYPNGRGSLEDVKKGIEILKSHNLKVRINCVVTPAHMKNIKRVANWFIKEIITDKMEGIRITFSLERGRVGLKMKPDYCSKNYKCKYPLDSLKRYAKVIVKMIKNGYDIYTTELLRKIETGGTYLRCGAATQEICVVPDGTVYPCHNFIDKKFELGNIKKSNFFPNPKIIKKFKQRNIFNLKPCQNCELQSICISAFDCPSHSYYDLGNFYKIEPEVCQCGYEIQCQILNELIQKKN